MSLKNGYYGPNINTVDARKVHPLPDMHCPEIGTSGINFWSESCRQKQKEPGLQVCYKGCAMIRRQRAEKAKGAKKARGIHDG